MKILNYFSIIILAGFQLTSCIHNTNKTDKNHSVSFFQPGFGGFTPRDSLIIKAQFSECGEWGGHIETIVINIDKEERYYATYKVYPINCDSVYDYHYYDRVQPTVDQKKLLTENGKQSIIDYIERLTYSKMTEKFPGHAGNTFSIIKSDSTFIIGVYDTKKYDVNSFNQLATELF